VESAWAGNGGAWKHNIASYERRDLAGLPALRALVEDCRARDIPTVFWNKEDPFHFDRFSEAASLFDQVFTTDADSAERYYSEVGAQSVDVLPFAAQARIHNPAPAVADRSRSPCFAGAWYRDRHQERQRSLEVLLDAARPFGLVIYDRTLGSGDPAFGFPQRFQPHVVGRLSYERVIDAYKSHHLFLNANSVVASPTMCSRRVFELLACDTAVLSTPSNAVAALFGGLVAIADEPDSATASLQQLLEDDDHRTRVTRAARREVFARHTYRHRLAVLARAVGHTVEPGPRLAAVALVDSQEGAARLATALAAQRTAPSEVVVGVIPGVEFEVVGLLDFVQVVQQNGDDREQRLLALARVVTTPWIAILDPAADYSEDHLSDLATAAIFVDADVIGALPNGPGQTIEHQFVRGVHPFSALASRDLLLERGWPVDVSNAWDRFADWARDGTRFYAGDSDSFRPPAIGHEPSPEELVITSS
jgi:hypothetical protein